MNTASDLLLARMTTHQDFPQAGILFRDITPVLADARSLRVVVAEMITPFVNQFDAIAGLEARGFMLASAAALEAGVGFLPIRKSGKLPGPVLRESYQLEYGAATFEMNAELFEPGSRILIMDDVLATGGTASAAASLVERAGWEVAGISVAMELVELNGRQHLSGQQIHSLLKL